MSLIKCKECSKEISSKAKTCPQCGATSKKKSNGCLLLIILLIVIAIVYLFNGGLNKNYRATSKSPSRSLSQQQIISNELKYLNDIEEISWYEVDGNTVYIGFKTRPSDISMILRGAALRANNAINFGAHVWGIKASNKGWRPGDGPYYEAVTARYGKIE